MDNLREHELFEIDVLESLGKAGFLRSLVFCGGTMLRLCHDLPRYSVDLDFYFSKKVRYSNFYGSLLNFLEEKYRLTDSKNKHYTLLYEFRGINYPKKLKIEIRKEIFTRGLEDKIAYSKYGSKQVLVRAFSMNEMAKRKILAIRGRDEIRDCFDLEFLFRKNAQLAFSKEDRAFIEKRLRSFKTRDYSVTLGSLLERDLRQFYIKHGFSHLLTRIHS